MEFYTSKKKILEHGHKVCLKAMPMKFFRRERLLILKGQEIKSGLSSEAPSPLARNRRGFARFFALLLAF